MTLFISNENQNLLYEMIHKTSGFETMFSSIDEKNRWFREIIEGFYKQIPQKHIDRETLKQMNREVLTYMVNSLKSRTPVQTQKPITILKREQPLQPKEYTSFFDIPKPQTIDFSEKIEDTIITNMDELIEEQKKMRERELQEYAPPPPVQQPSQSLSIQIQQGIIDKPAKLQILEEVSKEVLRPIEKHVQFELPSIAMDQLNNRMNQIEGKLDKLIQMFSHNEKKELINPVLQIKQLIAKEK